MTIEIQLPFTKGEIKVDASFRIRDFSIAPGGAFGEHIAVASSAEEKQGMRKLARKQAA